jgi:hypothetical protein
LDLRDLRYLVTAVDRKFQLLGAESPRFKILNQRRISMETASARFLFLRFAASVRIILVI